MKKLIIVFSILAIFSCSRENEIKNVRFWKFSGEEHLGDLLMFNSKNFTISNDTIYENKVPVFKIIEFENRFLIGDKVLRLKEINTNNIGRYVSK